MNKEKLEKNIWKVHLFQILEGFLFVLPVFVLFWQENGLSLTEVMLLQSIFSVVIVFLEVPSGYFSDIFGRKKTLIISAVFSALAMIIYAVGYNFWWFLIAELLFGVAVSFQSGTLSAFLFETLKELKREGEYKKLYGQSFFYGMIITGISGILGGLIGGYDLRWAVFATVPFYLLLVPLAFSLHEPEQSKKVEKDNYIKNILLSIKTEALNNNKLKWIIIYSAIIYSFNGMALWFYQPYFKITGLDIVYFGIVFAGFQVVSAFASKYAHKIEKKLGEKFSLLMLGFLVAGSYLLMSNFIFLFSFSFAFIQQFVRGFRMVVVSDYVNKLVQGDLRATILSIESLIGRLIYAIVIPIIGWVADIYTLENALTMVGVIVLFLAFVFLLIFRRMKIF